MTILKSSANDIEMVEGDGGPNPEKEIGGPENVKAWLDAGEIAVSVLLQLLGGRELGDVRYSLDSSLTVRGTTGPASNRLRGSAPLTGARPGG